MNKKLPIVSSPFLTFMLIFLLFSMLAYAEDGEDEKNDEIGKISYHFMGDQVFGISAGLFIPLFFNNPNESLSSDDAFTDTNLSLGGTGYLYYGAYLNNHWQLGLEIGAMFAMSPNEHNFYMVPISMRGSYEFQLNNNMFTVPVYLGAGVNMTTYQESFNVEFILKPGAGFFWNYNTNWSFGANATYWWVPQIYPDDSDYNRIGNFMDVSLSAVYHF